MIKFDYPKQLPEKARLKYLVSFWLISLPLFVFWVFPFWVITVINPFWFRQDLIDAFEDNVYNLSMWRRRMLKPQVDKWLLFDKIKG